MDVPGGYVLNNTLTRSSVLSLVSGDRRDKRRMCNQYDECQPEDKSQRRSLELRVFRNKKWHKVRSPRSP
jgi:hypothetical protein